MVLRLTRAMDPSEMSSEIVLCTCYTRNEGVTWTVLDALRSEVTSKDSLGNCDLLFHDLHILDNPQAVMTWPDGSTTDPDDTAYKILTDQGRIDCLVHPAMRGLLHWKSERFGKLALKIEFCGFFVWLLCVSVVVLLLPSHADAGVGSAAGDAAGTVGTVCARFTQYDGGRGSARAVLEITALLLQSVMAVVHGRDLRSSWKKDGKAFTCCSGEGKRCKKRQCRFPTVKVLLGLLPHASVVAVVLQRASGAARENASQCHAHISLLLLLVLSGWLKLGDYIQLQQQIGPFFIMVIPVLQRDACRLFAETPAWDRSQK